MAIVAVAAAGGSVVPAAQAGLDTIGPNGPLQWQGGIGPAGVSFSLTGVPDIDQARGTSADGTKVGLPNNGYMYCVPTTGMDFLAYLADRGFAGSLGVPSRDWTDSKNFNTMSVLLAQLGGEMGTDPVGGTGGDGFVAAMTKRLAKSEIGAVQIQSYALDDQGGAPTASDVIASGAAGDLLAAGIGFYKNEGTDQQPLLRRVGGHAFTIVGGNALPGAKAGTVFTRDPATVYTADTVQGAYTTDQHAIAPYTAKFVWADDNGVDHTGTSTVATWDASKTTLFEGFTRILPKTTWIQVGKQIVAVEAQHLVPDPGPLKHVYEVPGDGSVRTLALSTRNDNPAFLVKGSNTVWQLDALTGKSSKLGSVSGARALSFGGPGQRLFVAGKKKLVAFDRTGKVVGSKSLSAPLDALSFDARTNRLAGVGKSRLMFFDAGLHTLASRTLPAVQKKGSGTPLLAFGPKGQVVLGKSGQGAVLQGSPVAAATARRGARAAALAPISLKRRTLQGGGKVHGLAVDDLGQVLVSVGGKLRVFSPGGRRRATSPFAGLAGTAVLAVTRSIDTTGGTPFLQTLDRTVGPPPPVPPFKPDLIVTGIPNSTTVVVRNIGPVAAGPFTVRVTDVASAAGPRSIRFPDGLAPGGEAGIARNPCVAGRSYLADSLGEVQESNESNNGHTCGG